MSVGAFAPGSVVLYEGRVYDLEAQAWDTFDRGTHGDQPKPRCVVVSHALPAGAGTCEFVRVRLERWPDETAEYLIFDLAAVEVPT